LLCQITGAEAAIVVNNNAGAVLLALSALTKGGEVIVSRGELVEIGGKFRIPEVLELSGAILKEVGTTNRTRIEDYKAAVSEKTKAFLKVHTSNYRIVGFTESVSAEELYELSTGLIECTQELPPENFENHTERSGIPVIEDLGSGVLIKLDEYGLSKEPTVQEEVKAGADVVCFSGDKLFGGAQAGVLVGKKKYIDQMRNHPLLRALRADKFTMTAIEEVLKCYLDQKEAVQKIPTLRMLTRPVEEIKEKARVCADRWNQEGASVQIQVEKCISKAGGGALPETEIPSYGVALESTEITVEEIESRMRNLSVPVIGRIKEGRFLLDMRTFSEEGIEYLATQIRHVMERKHN
jgi:L-seryl-tRNA(Ser) seleniumtransferase